MHSTLHAVDPLLTCRISFLFGPITLHEKKCVIAEKKSKIHISTKSESQETNIETEQTKEVVPESKKQLAEQPLPRTMNL